VPALVLAADEGPRAGKYRIMTYGAPGSPPLHIVSWDSGPYNTIATNSAD